MAITGGDRLVWRELRRKILIPNRPTVLEIGRANWYGDIPAAVFHADRKEFEEEPVGVQPPVLDPWTVADWYYRWMLRNPERTAIDLDPNAGDCIRHDLNKPLEPGRRMVSGGYDYDIVINTGTAEHIFNQRQVWETMHDCCGANRLMVHSMPLWGWLDHGFYNYHPTFVADIALANGYDIEAWFYYEISTGFSAEIKGPAGIHALEARRGVSGMMHVAFKKTGHGSFKVPQQGVYRVGARPEEYAAWLANR